MIFFIIFDRAARRLLTWQSTLGVYVLLVLAIPVRVRSQCPECTGQYIKTVNTATGECISCFPCLSCDGDYTSSVPCGTTVPFGTEIKCVLIPSDSTALPLPISATSTTVHPTASSSAFTTSTIKGSDRSDTTKKQKSEKELALAEWKKNSGVYIFGGIFLTTAFVAVMYRIFQRNSRNQLPLPPVDHTRPGPSDVLTQDNETCSIDWATNTVEFRYHSDCTSEIGDGNQRSQCFAAQGTSDGNSKSSDPVTDPVDDVQLDSQSLSPVPLSRSLIVQDSTVADGMGQGRRIIWSALSQSEKYNTKVLEMPFPLLYKICLTLDIPRVDGNDVRMLAYKLGISVPGDLAFLKQAAITQPPDNNYFNNSTSYVVLTKKSSLAVMGLVDIMEDIGREDIIYLINNWSN